MSVGSGVERLETAVFGCLAFAESEVQLLVCSCVTLVFSAVGFLSPVHRGSILQVRCGKTCRYLQISSNPGPGSSWFHLGRGCCCFSPSPVYWQARSVVSKRANACRVFRLAGYTSARFYKMWKGEERAIYIYIYIYIFTFIYMHTYINISEICSCIPRFSQDWKKTTLLTALLRATQHWQLHACTSRQHVEKYSKMQQQYPITSDALHVLAVFERGERRWRGGVT